MSIDCSILVGCVERFLKIVSMDVFQGSFSFCGLYSVGILWVTYSLYGHLSCVLQTALCCESEVICCVRAYDTFM